MILSTKFTREVVIRTMHLSFIQPCSCEHMHGTDVLRTKLTKLHQLSCMYLPLLIIFMFNSLFSTTEQMTAKLPCQQILINIAISYSCINHVLSTVNQPLTISARPPVLDSLRQKQLSHSISMQARHWSTSSICNLTYTQLQSYHSPDLSHCSATSRKSIWQQPIPRGEDSPVYG